MRRRKYRFVDVDSNLNELLQLSLDIRVTPQLLILVNQTVYVYDKEEIPKK